MNTRNGFSRSMIRVAFTALLAILAATQMNAQSSQASRPFEDVQVLGTVPAFTGFPEGIAGEATRFTSPDRPGSAPQEMERRRESSHSTSIAEHC